MADTLTGKTIGKYKIAEKIGTGGMAEVYKGYQESLDRYVAIKLMHAFLLSEQDFLHRFQREARAMAALTHPNIVSVFDFDFYGENTYYLVMEYISGGSLKDKLESLAKDNERMPLAESVRIAREVADALAYAHSRNMIHRDIKPANIMLGETGRAILTDFGIVKMLGGQSMAYTATGALIGTPSYMSPEQALGKPGDERVDIYSLGILLFQMVTGQLPYDADTPLAVVMKHVNDPTPLPGTFNPDIPQELQAIILKAMAKDPEERYHTAAELATELREADLTKKEVPAVAPPPPKTEPKAEPATAVSATEPSPTTATDTAAPTDPPQTRSPWLYVGLVALLLVIGGGGAMALGLFNGGNEEATPVVAAADTREPTDTPRPSATTPVETETTPELAETPDVVASAIAAIALTEEAVPTNTNTPTRTPLPTHTPLPDLTATFVADCTIDVELVAAYTYQNARFSSAPVGVTFPMNWTLKNSGTCPWPADLQWGYMDGDTFEAEETTILLDEEVTAEQEVTLTTDFVAPRNADQYESTWQFQTTAGEPFGPPIAFELSTYVPATATPRVTNTPAAQPTATRPEQELNYIHEVLNCTYAGDDWRCGLRITPYGGTGGPYAVFIFDQPGGQASTYNGVGPFSHFALARRCSAYNTEVRVRDEATGEEMARHVYIDPDDHFSGGCVKP